MLTRIGGAAEQVTPGANGFLFEPGDIDALTAHLKTLADKGLRSRMGAQANKVVRDQFTLDKMAAAYDRELAQVVGVEQPAPTKLAHSVLREVAHSTCATSTSYQFTEINRGATGSDFAFTPAE